ncbi:hypothetical protein M3Y96_01166000 [Aphelenchoides besseyi]|nr:hypothetical protein M3Y96_01166000 [Aphelenchoides besseyi]
MKFVLVGVCVLFLGSRTSATPLDEDYGCIIRNATALYYDQCQNRTEIYLEWSKEQTVYFLMDGFAEVDAKFSFSINDCTFEVTSGTRDGEMKLKIGLNYIQKHNESFGVQITTAGQAQSIESTPQALCDEEDILNETAQGNLYAKIITDSDSNVPPREFDPLASNQTTEQATEQPMTTTTSTAIDLIHFPVASLMVFAVIVVMC